jgi:hypothetical protein
VKSTRLDRSDGSGLKGSGEAASVLHAASSEALSHKAPIGSRREPAWALVLLGGLAVVGAGDAKARERDAERTPERTAERTPELAWVSRGAPLLGSRVPGSAVPMDPDPWDLERAGPRKLRRLPGVGEQRALELAEARWSKGAGRVFRDLEAEPGIGPITARRIGEFLARERVALPPPREDTDGELELERPDPTAHSPTPPAPAKGRSASSGPKE